MAMTTEKSNDKSIVEFTPFGTKDKIQLSIEIVKRLVAVKTKSGKSCSDEDAFKFMLMCQARKLNPFEGDAFLIGYDSQHGPSFSLITAHQAFLKRAELHPEFDGMESGTIVQRNNEFIDLIGDWHMPGDKILGGWAKVFFKNRSHPMHKRLRLERFNKRYGIWNDDPAGMIVKCTEADALRSSFPTMLGGLYITEEFDATQGEIARPQFPETVTATVVETPAAEQQQKKTTEPPVAAKSAPAAEPPKKKATLERKKSSTATAAAPASTETFQESDLHKTLREQLKRGNCSPGEFVQFALAEGWLEPGDTWDSLSEKQLREFTQPENFNVMATMIDERRAQQAHTSAPARTGELL